MTRVSSHFDLGLAPVSACRAFDLTLFGRDLAVYDRARFNAWVDELVACGASDVRRIHR